MPSPFPGMDPYLEHEDVSHDFHLSAVVVLRELLNRALPPGVEAWLKTSVYHHGPESLDEDRRTHIEVRDGEGASLLAVLEMLRLDEKKPGTDERERYLRRRDELRKSGTHLVELDLLRGGQRLPAVAQVDCDYCATVSYATPSDHVAIWPVKLRDRLPTVAVPLKGWRRDVPLDLQAMLDLVYDRAGYARWIYQRAPQPPLNSIDAEWAVKCVQLQAAG